MDTSILSHARIVIPVRNGGARWREAATALSRALPDPSRVVAVDSSSSDGSDAVATQSGFELHRIDVRTFNHGRTRQEAVDRYCDGMPFVIFLTQDAVVEDVATLVTVLEAFGNERVGAAYGRQLPHHGAQPFEAHAALFNYPPHSDTRWLADASRLGIKTAFFSNSFAAYRIDALRDCGGFPSHLILAEDTYVAMHMLVNGWGVRYCADALVRHSHDYSIMEDMRRYFDFGVVHAQMPELLQHFGTAEGEGMRFVSSELRYVLSRAPGRVPEVFVRNFMKYVGYRLGRSYTWVPRRMRRSLSMTKGFWDPPPPGERAPRRKM